MTEAERQIAALLAQAQMDRESAPSSPSALAAALTKHIPEDKPRFGRWQPDALASGQTAKAGIVGKLLGALGLDADGNRAATSWTDAAKHTAGNLINAPQDVANQLLDLQDYQPVYGTGASNPEDRARAGQQAVSTFGLAGLAPLGGVVAGRAAQRSAGGRDVPPRQSAPLESRAEAPPSPVAPSALDIQADILNRVHQQDMGRVGEATLQRAIAPEAFSGITQEGNIGNAAKFLMPEPGQDPVPGVRRLDGSALYANSKEGAVPGLLAQAGEQKGITAYHGSPHDFDKFSLDKIGTGEGAQAYGHGLYFAENEGVARNYRETLADGYKIDGQPFNASTTKGGSADIGNYAADALSRFNGDRDKAIQWLREGGSPSEMRAADMLGKAQSVEPWNGRMYEVRIAAEPDQFLDWDKPLSQQSEKVKSVAHAARNAFTVADESPGLNIWTVRDDKGRIRTSFNTKREADAYVDKILVEGFRSPEASAALRDAGVPGIRYLDQGSRTAGEGSRNFVVFDENLISIVKKYGWAGAAALYGMTAEELQAQAPDDMQPVRNRLTKALTSD